MATGKPDILIRFGGAVDASLKSSMSAIGAGVGKLKDSVFSLNGALGALGVGSIFAGVFSATRDSADAAKQLDAILKSTGGTVGFTADQMKDYAGQLQAVTTAEDDAIVKGEVALLKYANVRGKVFLDSIRLAIDMSAREKTAIEESADTIGRAMNDPKALKGIKGLTGAQRELLKALYDTGNKAEYQKRVLAELKREYAGSADITSLNDQVTALGNAFGNLFEGSGDPRPGFESLINTLNDPSVKSAFATIADGIISITSAAASGLTKLVEWSQTLSDALSLGVAKIQSFIAQKEFDSAKLRMEQAAKALQEAQAGVTGYMDGGVVGIDEYNKAREIFDKSRADFDSAAKKLREAQGVVELNKPNPESGKPAGPPEPDKELLKKQIPKDTKPLGTSTKSSASRTANKSVAPDKPETEEEQATRLAAEAAASYEQTRRIADAEGKLWQAHQMEINAISAGDEGRIAEFQRKQEEYLKDLTDAGASKERVDMLSKVVGEDTQDPNKTIKFKAALDLDSFAALSPQIQEALVSGNYDLTFTAAVQVTPELIDSPNQDAIQKQADKSGGTPE